MEYSVEELSPIKKKIKIEVSPDEVNAALGSARALLKEQVHLDGFRKGKVPDSVLEKKFHQSIEKDARENLINVHINEILQETGLEPITGIAMSGEDTPLEKGKGFEYSMEFEVMPKFELPPYEGLEVEEKKSEVNDKIVDSIIQRLCLENSKLVPVDGADFAKDGQFVNIDFEVYKDGKLLDQFKGKDFVLALGSGEALPDFEALVKTVPLGHTGEGEIHFAEDFLAPELAGQTATLKVTLHGIREREIPAADDSFAQSIGYKNAEDLRHGMSKAYEKARKDLNKSEAQKKLLTHLVKQVDYPLPESLVKQQLQLLMNDYIERLNRVGKNPIRSKEDFENLETQLRSQAEEMAREKILLMAIARKENLEVAPDEVHNALYASSQKLGIDFRDYLQRMQSSGVIFQFRDNMLCDKAMDLVYERAKVTPVDAESDDFDIDASKEPFSTEK